MVSLPISALSTVNCFRRKCKIIGNGLAKDERVLYNKLVILKKEYQSHV